MVTEATLYCLRRLTVRLLVASAGSATSELLGLAAARVSNEQGLVVGLEDVLDLLLGSLIDVCTTRAPR